MAAPQILSYSTRSESAAGTSVTATMPSGLSSGDVLLILLGSNVALGSAAVSGYESLSSLRATRRTGDLAGSMRSIYRVCDGSESGLTITGLSSGRHISMAIRLSPGSIILPSPIVGTTGATGDYPCDTALHPDHPLVDISESHDYLMLAPFCFSKNNGFSFTPPSGYSSVTSIPFVTAGTYGYPVMALSQRSLTTGADHNPSASVLSDTGTADFRWWVASTIAIHLPASVSRRNKLMGAL